MTSTTKTTEQSIADMAVIAQAAQGDEPESTGRKQVSLEEVIKMLSESIPAIGEKFAEVDQMMQQVLACATTRRFPGNLGMEIRMTTWRDEGWPAILNDLTIVMTELLSWQSFLEKETEIRSLRKELADATKQAKAQAKAANAKAVIGDKPAATKADEPQPEAEADGDKPKTTQRRSRKKAEEPVAA